MRILFYLLFTISLSATPTIEILGEFDQRPGNPAVAADGGIYFSMHPFDQPQYKVMRLEKGQGIPFPTPEISQNFAAVIGIQADAQGHIWMLDMGSSTQSPKLLSWNTHTDSLGQILYLPQEVTVNNSFIQDFAIDEKRGMAYIADMSRSGMIDSSEPAIIVVNLSTGQARRVLQSHPALQANSEKTMVVEGQANLFTDAQKQHHPLELGLNPIAIDAQNEWVYFSTIHPGTLHRIPARALANPHISEQDLAATIEAFAPKPTSDGIAADGQGRVYITNLEDNAISIADATGTRTWVQDPRFIWPDGLYIAPDGSVIATINQLNRAAPFNKGVNGAQPPYLIVRISE